MAKKQITFFALMILDWFLLVGCVRAPSMISTVIQNCLLVQDAIPSTANMRGMLVLPHFHSASLFDVNTQTETILENFSEASYSFPALAPIIDISPGYISPDRNKLVYLIPSQQNGHWYERMVVVTTEGQYYENILQFGSERQDFDLIGWFDNNRVLLSLDRYPYGIIGERDQAFGTILLYNPFSGESELILPSFLELYRPQTVQIGDNPIRTESIYVQDFVTWFFPIYDLSLSRAIVYLSDGEQRKLILWDVDEHENIWEREMDFEMYYAPQWSPRGDQFIFVERDEGYVQNFHSVSRYGNEIQLTDLGQVYSRVSLGKYSWSPDGRYIAFWFNDFSLGNSGLDTQLAVLDLRKGEITNYCVGPGSDYPVWSPDGSQIAVSIYESEDGNRPRFTESWPSILQKVVIVDIEQNIAFRVSNGYVVGWMLPFDGQDAP